MPYEFILPDVIIGELIQPPGELLIRLGYAEEGIAGEEFGNIIDLRKKYTAPSTNDLFALLLAKKNSCPLITGDRALRKAAEQERVVAHGLLWLIDAMVNSKILPGTKAADALKNIIAAGSWLPKKECEERLKRWGKANS